MGQHEDMPTCRSSTHGLTRTGQLADAASMVYQ